MKKSITILTLAGFALMASLAMAGPGIVSDTKLIETMPIQGIHLAMKPENAVDHLLSQGYQAGNIKSSAGWDSDGIEMVRGDPQSPMGISRITISRKDSVLTYITETYNRPRGERFSADEEIGRAQKHLGVPPDSDKCKIQNANAGSCRARDADDAADASMQFEISVVPTMIMRTAVRR